VDDNKIIISCYGTLKLINRVNENSEIRWILISNGNFYLYLLYMLDLHNKETWLISDFWPIIQVNSMI